MRKPSKTEEAYHNLEKIGSLPITEETIATLKSALNSTTSLLVSKAADIAGSTNIQELIPDMVSAFNRFMINGAKVDKQCNAKNSIGKALVDMEFTGDSIYLAGAYYIQMEPALGGPVDTATELRCNCAFGLARIGHRDVHYVLADLLVDNERVVRVAAAKALTFLGDPESELLLRLKVLTVDSEIDVMAECFSGLMTMAPERSLDFVARYLQSNDPALLECAALAIGQSHMPRAFEVLKNCWNENIASNLRWFIILPIALLRTDDAFNFLVKIVRAAETNLAGQALSALSLYADEESVKRVREAVLARGDKAILDKFDQEFTL